jgi:hypothetical protein
MGLKFLLCKRGGSGAEVGKYSNPNRPKVIVCQSSLAISNGGDIRKHILALLQSWKSMKDSDFFLLNPEIWLRTKRDLEHSAGRDEDDESDNETSPVPRHSSPNIFYALLNWISVHKNLNGNDLYIMSEYPLKPYFSKDSVQILAQSNSFDTPENRGIYIRNEIISGHCVCVRGRPQSGKTSSLFSIAQSYEKEAVWLLPHEIVHCELGETSRLIRARFSKAAGNRPSLVLMDDMDLTLNTSGKIIRECIEEIGNCVSEYSSVVFVFSLTEDVDPFIMKKVDRFIDLNS